MVQPIRRDRPHFPDGYGIPESEEGLLGWEEIERKLVASLHYWLSTTRPDGRPHVVPRWGAWIDGQLFYDGSPETVHARNTVTNAACALHVGDGAEAIIIDGTSAPSEPVTAAMAEPIAAEIGRKYGDLGYRPEPDAWSGPDAGGLRVFTPSKALAWSDFATDPTRFVFEVS